MRIEFAKKQRTIQSLLTSHNTKCFECSLTSSFVNLTNATFVCTDCAGILRSIGHKLKSITASTFTEEEIKELERRGGNSKAGKMAARVDQVHDRYRMENYLASKYSNISFDPIQQAAVSQKADLLSIEDDSEVIPFHNPYQMKFFGQYQNANLQMTPDTTTDDLDLRLATCEGSTTTVTKKAVEILRTTKVDDEDDFDEFQSAPAVDVSNTEVASTHDDPYAAFRSIDNVASSVFNSKDSTKSPVSREDSTDPYAAFKHMTLDTRRTSIFDSHTSIKSSNEALSVRYPATTADSVNTTKPVSMLDDLLGLDINKL
jgi:hypothetical protein